MSGAKTGRSMAMPELEKLAMHLSATPPRTTPFALEVRKTTRFDFTDVPAIHTADNLYVSHFFNALSLVAPITEGMLIRAIRDAQPLLEGTSLVADAQAFVGQEATHTREHRELNRRLGALGFDVETLPAKLDALARRNEAKMSLRKRLAIVVAGEHVIYAICRAFLTCNRSKFVQHPEVTRLLAWHALEEMEHQSVCDDIYRHLFGSGPTDRLLYTTAYLGTNRVLYRAVAKLMQSLLADDRPPRDGELKEFRAWLFREPGIGNVAARELLGWFSPTFEHWRRDEDRALIDASIRLVYGAPGTRG